MSNESENQEESTPVAHIEANFSAPMSWELRVYAEDLEEAGITELRLEDIEGVWIKYGECTIKLKNGNEISLGQGNFGETDYKWPESFALYSESWSQLAEDKDFE